MLGADHMQVHVKNRDRDTVAAAVVGGGGVCADNNSPSAGLTPFRLWKSVNTKFGEIRSRYIWARHYKIHVTIQYMSVFYLQYFYT